MEEDDLTEEEQGPLMQEEPVADIQEPETMEEHRETEENSVIVEEPLLAADYINEETPETELEPVQMNRNNVPVEEPAEEPEDPVEEPAEEPEEPVEKPVEELESVAEMDMKVESEKEENLLEEATLEADYIVDDNPEEVMEP